MIFNFLAATCSLEILINMVLLGIYNGTQSDVQIQYKNAVTVTLDHTGQLDKPEVKINTLFCISTAL